MTREEAIETLKENSCSMCAYGSQSMMSCDIRGCDNRDAIKALEQEPCDITTAFQLGMAFGFAKKYDEMDNLMEEVKKAIEQGQKPCGDCVSRQWLMECVDEGWIKFDTEKDENTFVHLVRDIAPSEMGGG